MGLFSWLAGRSSKCSCKTYKPKGGNVKITQCKGGKKVFEHHLSKTTKKGKGKGKKEQTTKYIYS